MTRRELPQALTLERFAAGKDGRANAFKKKKQANKRKLFEKAQLKRQYAKLLRKETAATGAGHEAEAWRPDGAADVAKEDLEGPLTLADNRRGKGEARGARTKRGREHPDGENGEREEEVTKESQQLRKPGKWRRPEHRPDPFKAAKATADERRQEAEKKQRKRDMQIAEKEARAKKRRKQHALLSKRTRGGQPVMKNTMKYLLEKIHSQT